MSFVAAALKPRSLLVATDFSESSQKALRHALAIARFYQSKLCLAHVVCSLGLTLAGPAAIDACEDAALRDAAELQQSLARTGDLSGLQHKFIVRHGEVWPELKEIIRQEACDLIVIGTHGAAGIRKLFFGSTAEEIFRQADCPVLILGPNSHERPWMGTSSSPRTFLFATASSQRSVDVLPYAVAVANHFEAKLVFLSVVPAVSCSGNTNQELSEMQEDVRVEVLNGLAKLASRAALEVRPEFWADSNSRPASEVILEAARNIQADLIIMGVHHSAHAGLVSHLGPHTAYEVACQAYSPTLLVPVH